MARKTPKGRMERGLAGLCFSALRGALALGLALALLLGLALGIFAWRLSAEPLPVPWLAELAAKAATAQSREAEVTIGAAVIALGREGAPSGVEFRDIAVRDLDGALLMKAPRLVARFHMADLVAGRLMPSRIVLPGASVRVLRAADGRIRVSIGEGLGFPVEEGGAADAAAQAGALDAVARIVDGFVGDVPPIPELARLERVAIADAELSYVDAVSGRRWDTAGSSLEILKTEDGARAVMRAAVTDDRAQRTRVGLTATRRAGTGRTELAVRIGDLMPAALADQTPETAALARIEAPLTGGFRATIGPGGRLESFGGQMRLGPGRILGLPEGFEEVERLAARLDWQPGLERLRLDAISLETGALSAEGAAILELEEIALEGPIAAAAQVTLSALRVDLPDRFAEPLAFDGGQVFLRGRLGQPGQQPELVIADAWLRDGPLVLGAEGHVRRGGLGAEDIRLRLRARAEGLTIADLKRLWPKGLAANARDWAVENLVSGRIDSLVAHIGLEPEAPTVALDFTFSELVSRYLGPMTPVTGARGRAHVTEDALYLAMEEGAVRPGGGAPIDMAGSHIAITDFSGIMTPADATIRAEGPVSQVLALMDEEPLGLVGKLGLDPDAVEGRARVGARLAFPLLDDLLLEQIGVEAEAELLEVSLPVPTESGPEMRLVADRLGLVGDTGSMVLEGDARLDGVPVAIRWEERYGTEAEARIVDLAATVDEGLIERFGLEIPGYRGGSAAARVRLEEAGGGTGFRLEADIAGMGFAIPSIRWEKAQGAAGRLTATGRMGEALTIEAFALETEGLSAEGAVRLDPEGELVEATVDPLVLDTRAELSARVAPGAAGGYDIRIRGPRLDLSGFLNDPPQTAPAEGAPVAVDLDIAELKLTEKIRLTPARGTVNRSAEGRIEIALSGSAGSEGRSAPFEGTYARSAGEPGHMALTGSDAGALLSGVGFFQGGHGGTLDLEATLGPSEGTDVAGRLRIEGMAVRGQPTFGEILAEGGVSDAADAVRDGGITFSDITVPFRYRDGVILIDDMIARSNALALKVEGAVDEAADRIALSGVISPGFAVTGAFDGVPVLGQVLGGGRGEGIIAMTFQVRGTLDDPDFQVNPLSLLTPGFLRNIFEGEATDPSQRFLDQLERQN